MNEIDFEGKTEANTHWGYAKVKEELLTNKLLNQKSHQNGFETIVPADTWNQPFTLTSDQKESLEKIALQNYLQFLQNGQIKQDSDIFYSLEFTKALRSIESLPEELQNNLRSKCFSEIKYFQFYFDDHEKKLLLRDARMLMKMIGPSIEKIILNGLWKHWPNNAARYLYKISQLSGNNLHTLILRNIYNDETWIKPLNAILKRIKLLDISTNNYDFDEYDLNIPEMCPQLETLKIRMNMKGEFLPKYWPTLIKFSNQHNEYMTEQLQWDLMKKNPQIKYLKIDASDCNNLTKKIVEYLPKLEVLCLTDNYPGFSTENLSTLLELKHLSKLKLKNIDEQVRDEILGAITKFINLKVLKVYFWAEEFNDEDESEWKMDLIPEISKSLQRLECFHLNYFLLRENPALEFIANAKKLKTFDIRGCGLTISADFLDKMVEARNLNKSNSLLELIFFEKELNVAAESVSTMIYN